MYNLTTPNLIALASNISRVYEIAKTGNHTVRLIASENACKQDIDLLNEFYGFESHINPDMIIEVAYSPNDVLACFKIKQDETLGDINKRIPKQINVSDVVDSVSFKLLNVAIERLNLGVNDVLIIHRLAKSIAALGQCDKIKVEHIAEAIQYRSFRETID